MSWAWHRAWADSAAPESAAAGQAIVLYGAEGRVEAILPVRLRSIRFRRLPLEALTWAVGDTGCPDHLDVAAAPDADFGALVAGLESLPWHLLRLGNLAADAPNHMKLQRELERRGFAVQRRSLWRAPYLELPESWDDYLAGQSRNRRQTLKRKERKLRREHEVRVLDYGPERLEEGWRRLRALHELRWDGAGAFQDPEVVALHRRFTAELARRGALWLSCLEVDDRPTAAWYGFPYRDTVYFYQSGRDPAYDRQSVGDILMAAMIRRAIERGYRRFDFLRGEESYKWRWTRTARTLEELVVFRPTLRGGCLRALDWTGRLRERLRSRGSPNGSEPAFPHEEQDDDA